MSIGLVFSAIGATCLAISSFAKTKKSMLSWQLSDYFFTMVANFLLGGYTGAISISVSIIRNTLMIKKWDSIYTTILLIIIQVTLGIHVNNLGLIGCLPLISSVSYTIVSFLTDRVQWLRWVTVENMLLWSLYDFTIKAYPALVMDVVITIITLIAIKKYSGLNRHTQNTQD
ncbi:MAG: YgjV family protein [Streptococcus sp.]|uniref:YgjV family protein n=1 Tax=Streptococcus sp. TaxID=1306 RepID=UPI00258D656E|nr:YgjV family protein [Streptococcus sp.]MCR5051178.1 YgjV family protein [Streptococcus sp.]